MTTGTAIKAITHIAHPAIEKDNFSNSGKIIEKTFENDDELIKYYKSEIQPVQANRILSFYKESLNLVLGEDKALKDFDVSQPKDIFSPKIHRVAEGAIKARGLAFWNWNYWSSEFFEHPNHQGKSFTIGGRFKNYDLIADVGSRWDNQITSVDTGKLVPLTVLFEHPHFKGERLVLMVDSKDLRDKKMSGGRTWDDQMSSAAVAIISLDDLLKLLALV